MEENTPLSDWDMSRRGLMQKGALASGALVFGGTSIGSILAQDGTDAQADGQFVFMLYPDAVENATVTVVSEEIDWKPWEDQAEPSEDTGANGNETEDNVTVGNETETPAVGDGMEDNVTVVNETETPAVDDGMEDNVTIDNETETPAVGDGMGAAGDFRTHLVEYNFSPSHVVPAFVPSGASLGVGDEVSLGKIDRLFTEPEQPLDEGDAAVNGGVGEDEMEDNATAGDGMEDNATANGGMDEDEVAVDDGVSAGADGQALLVRIALEDGMAPEEGMEPTDNETGQPSEPDEEAAPAEEEQDGAEIDIGDNETDGA